MDRTTVLREQSHLLQLLLLLGAGCGDADLRHDDACTPGDRQIDVLLTAAVDVGRLMRLRRITAAVRLRRDNLKQIQGSDRYDGSVGRLFG